MSTKPSRQSEVHRPSRRTFLAGSAVAAGAAATLLPTIPAAADSIGSGRKRTPATATRTAASAVPSRRHTRIGIGYQTWFSERVSQFQTAEAIPVLGKYKSTDPLVIRQHTDWLRWAGVDYLLVDWSNNLGANWTNGTAESIIKGTDALIHELREMPRQKRLDVTLLIGMDAGEAGTKLFNEQIDVIKSKYFSKPAIRKLFLAHEGKPLLTIYTGARTTEPPDWDDPDFTIRWMGAFREIVLNPGGQWSWKDRVPFANGGETPASHFDTDGLKGWKATGGWKLSEITLQPAFDRTVKITCANSDPGKDGTQQRGTLTSPVFTLTEPVLSFNAIGTDMAARGPLPETTGRNVFVLKDAKSGEILRHASPPGDPNGFHVRQWNVRDLKGRKVVFEAINDNPFAYPLGWIGFDRLFQQRAEQITVCPAHGGNQGPGSYTTWEAKKRAHGATLMEGVQGAFDFEPEFLQFTAWNEFGAPDQFDVTTSNDLEPTKMSGRNGDKSDGWGYYYLDLMHDLIEQYRRGEDVPSMQLDTTYP